MCNLMIDPVQAFEVFLGRSGEAEAPEEQSVQHSVRDLALWRIQSATLPGSQAIYHVHVPHYVAMFGELLDGPKPQRFGHVYLPGGSVNLGNPAFELRPGTSAPLTGIILLPDPHSGNGIYSAMGQPPKSENLLLLRS